VGWKGVLQPIADAIKLLMKEQIVPVGANKALFLLAPVISVAPALAAWAIVPFTPDVGHRRRRRRDPGDARHDLDGHLRRDHRRLGVELEVRVHRRHARRRADGLLRARDGLRPRGRAHGRPEHALSEIVARQDGNWGFIEWFWLPLFPLFVIHYIAGLAETNRHPFDVAEGESEIVAGLPRRVLGNDVRGVLPRRVREHDPHLDHLVARLHGRWLSPFNFAFMRDAARRSPWLAAPGHLVAARQGSRS
jgi:NADH-quinone oxidoreductase subunit H